MSLIIRIDVDRPYGQKNIFLKALSRVTSDLYLPRIKTNCYLNELNLVLQLLNEKNISALIFFRKITFPSKRIIELMLTGQHIYGFHLENSKTFSTFVDELDWHKKRTGNDIKIFSKHGSGKYKYGFKHYVPYEPEKYIDWGLKTGMKYFFGNGENPNEQPKSFGQLTCYPSAFWLEPQWRDVEKYDEEWLIENSKYKDIVLLFHPDNIIFNKKLFDSFNYILDNVKVKKINP